MTTGTLEIHSENILPIIKRWLYSDKDIFVRELVSNACDAIQKLKILRDRGDASAGDEELRIDLTIEGGKLTISDTGIGMTSDEVRTYIAQLAFSGAEHFLEKYKSEEAGDQIIGHFGLGFYSAFMVADRVEIQTQSYCEEPPAHWVCDGGAEYTLDEGSRSSRGTDIILHISEEEYLDASRLRGILTRYCAFLPFPIYLNGDQINKSEPLWMRPAADCTDDDYRAFYRELYPMEEEPLFWIHLNVDVPFQLKGILFFPRIRRDLDLSKNGIKLFCNRVFVSDDCRDLIPDWLNALRGAIDSPDIPLNVSRSALQVDRTVRQVAGHIAKKVSDRLVQLSRSDREHFLACWRDLEIILKLGAMQDDKFFQRVEPCLVWKNLDAEWTTLTDYPHDRILYTSEEREPPHLDLYKRSDVLQVNPYIDNHFMTFLERKRPNLKFRRIDAEIDDSLLNSDSQVLDAEGKTQSTRMADYAKKSLAIENLEVAVKSLQNDDLPALLVLDEEGRRLRDTFRASQMHEDLAHTLVKQTLILNSANPLVSAIYALRDTKSDLATSLLHQLYDLARLSQREMDPKSLDGYVRRSNNLILQLIQS